MSPRPAGDAPVSVRLRDGDREVEVHGSPAFCRQLLDDLPSLMARVRGEGGRAATISLPPPTPAVSLPSLPVEVETEAQAQAQAQAEDDLDAMATDTHQGGRAAPSDGTAVRAAAPRAERRAARRTAATKNGRRSIAEPPSLDDSVLGALRSADRPLTIAELRRRLPDDASGQAVRRILERAPDRVVNIGGRPATYRAR